LAQEALRGSLRHRCWQTALKSVKQAGLASEMARLRARFVIKDSDDSLKGAA